MNEWQSTVWMDRFNNEFKYNKGNEKKTHFVNENWELIPIWDYVTITIGISKEVGVGNLDSL